MDEKTCVQLETYDGVAYQQPTGLLIGGQFQLAEDHTVFETINPYTQKAICSVSRGKDVDIDRAVSAAQGAFRSWSQTTPRQRGALLSRLADLIERDVDILTSIEVSFVTSTSL